MKYALVTGASRGIGRAIAVQLAKSGWTVIINYCTNQSAAESVKQEIEEFGGQAEILGFDVSDTPAVENALEKWCNEHPDEYISLLVNNAGIRMDTMMIFMQDEQWNKLIDVNLNSFFFITRRLLKNMLTHRNGRIINISSLSGIKGMAGQVNYSATKAALIGATKSLAQEVAGRKITVNAIAPGFISTDMTGDLDEKSLKKMIPAGRFGNPEEVANLVDFLASDKAAYITGEVISINGGLYT